MYSIKDNLSTVSKLEAYINLNIQQCFERKNIEWIINNCKEDVVNLFCDAFYKTTYLIPTVRFLLTGIIQPNYIFDSSFDPSIFTYDELVRINNAFKPYINNKIVKYYITMGYDNLIPKDYHTYDQSIAEYLDSIGHNVNFEDIIVDLNNDISPYIIKRAIEQQLDVIFYPTINNVNEIIKHVKPDQVWDFLLNEDCTINILEHLYDKSIPIGPNIEGYIEMHKDWTLDHLHYFNTSDVLMRYIGYSDIPTDLIERLDYPNIKLDRIVYLTYVTLTRIKALKHKLNINTLFKLLGNNHDDSFLLELSYLGDIKYDNHDVDVVSAIRLLHYIPNIKVTITKPSVNADILKTVAKYNKGYETLCNINTSNTVKYIMSLIDRNA